MVNYVIQDLTVGMFAVRSYLFSSERISSFAHLVDDMAPVHFDSDFAKLRGYKERIVHGLFVQSIASGMLGNDLPGPYSVISSISTKMHRPTFIGQTVKYRIEITSLTHAVGAVSLSILGEVDGQTVISGKAICCFPSPNRN